MTRDEVLQILRDHMGEFRRDYDVKDLALFGSVARGENGESSDVDVLVEFAGVGTADKYFGLKWSLEELFDQRVDLVTKRALKKAFEPTVRAEAVHVA